MCSGLLPCNNDNGSIMVQIMDVQTRRTARLQLARSCSPGGGGGRSGLLHLRRLLQEALQRRHIHVGLACRQQPTAYVSTGHARSSLPAVACAAHTLHCMAAVRHTARVRRLAGAEQGLVSCPARPVGLVAARGRRGCPPWEHAGSKQGCPGWLARPSRQCVSHPDRA